MKLLLLTTHPNRKANPNSQHLWTRGLDTTHRMRISICYQPCKIFPTSSLITLQNLVVVSQTICTHVSSAQKTLGSCPFGMSHDWPLETRYCPMCHHTKFGHCMGIGRGRPKFRGCWGPPPWDVGVVTPLVSPVLPYHALPCQFWSF